MSQTIRSSVRIFPKNTPLKNARIVKGDNITLQFRLFGTDLDTAVVKFGAEIEALDTVVISKTTGVDAGSIIDHVSGTNYADVYIAISGADTSAVETNTTLKYGIELTSTIGYGGTDAGTPTYTNSSYVTTLEQGYFTIIDQVVI